jgi:adsorption protein B
MILELWLIATSIAILCFLIDDLLIDLLALKKSLRQSQKKHLPEDTNDESPLAILVAAWKEEQVLEKMVLGNLTRFLDKNVHFFLGVYPNDKATLEVAKKLAAAIPNVHLVVNPLPGPTCKGQMLNEAFKALFKTEAALQIHFKGVALHDAEDVIDEEMPQVYRLGLLSADLVQTPVFSFRTKWNQFVAGTYVDEFAEVHGKELFVREHLGAGVPSAGVGTCLSRKLVLDLMFRNKGEIFKSDSLAEDYHLAMTVTTQGYKTSFQSFQKTTDDGKTSVIATREYFPREFWASIRQKTRWSIGIALQSSELLGWFGRFWQKYFLWRDRRSILNGFLTLNLLLAMVLIWIYHFPDSMNKHIFQTLLLMNSIGTILRILSRMYYVQRHYGLLQALLVIPRWPFALSINTLSGFRALYEFALHKWRSQPLTWKKTDHWVPPEFDQVDFHSEVHTFNAFLKQQEGHTIKEVSP